MERIVLIHGLAAHRVVLGPLSSRLSSRGFKTQVWGYRSLWSSIETHAARFGRWIEKLSEDATIGQIHLVGHSMGSIIIRQLLQQARPEKLGRVVLIAPPNRGSHVATALVRAGLRFRPLRQLADTSESFIRRLPEPSADVPIGILAASHDRVVPIDSTRLNSCHDYRLLRGGHTSILFQPLVADLVANFCRHGSFRIVGQDSIAVSRNQSGPAKHSSLASYRF